MTCEEVFELLSDYLDNELSNARKSAFECHVEVCDRCAQFGREFETIVMAVRAANRPEPPEALMAKLEKLGGFARARE